MAKFFALIVFSMFMSITFAQSAKVELDGTYEYSYLSYESIEISGEDFKYTRFSDEFGDPWHDGFPISGKIKVANGRVWLLHNRLAGEENVFRVVVVNGVAGLVLESDYNRLKDIGRLKDWKHYVLLKKD